MKSPPPPSRVRSEAPTLARVDSRAGPGREPAGAAGAAGAPPAPAMRCALHSPHRHFCLPLQQGFMGFESGGSGAQVQVLVDLAL